MKKISFLSVPGLPNGVWSLDSTVYHDYKAVLGVVKKVTGAEVDFDAYIWPREIPHPYGRWALYVPGLTIPLYYYPYVKDEEFRKKVVDGAVDYIKKGLEKNDVLLILAHSHGNRIVLDAIDEMAVPKGKKIYMISMAPAYANVCYGLIPTALNEGDLKRIGKKLEAMFVYRVGTDFLSGKPAVECHTFRPRVWDLVWWGHASVRSRKDVMRVLEEELASF